MSTERVQKILAKTGIASRRKSEELIAQGLVTINGKVAKLGDKATLGTDAIKVNGKLLRNAEAKVYLAFHKPKGVISMLVDTENRPNLSNYLSKVKERVFPVGRLDFTSEGLILLTNDGDFAEKLQRRDDIPRVYRIKIRGHLTEEMVKRIERGARIEKRTVRPHAVRISRELESKSEVEVVMMGAGAVDVRSMVEMKGFLVERITRTAVGHITLRGLPAGHYRLLKESQAMALLEQPELGMKVLAREIEASKPGGQRNFHVSKKTESTEDGEIINGDSEESPRASSPPRAPVPPRKTPFANKKTIRRPAGYSAPRTSSLDIRRSDSRRPDSARPDSRRPDSRRPDSRRPDSRSLDSRQADTRRPDSRRPDSRRPDSRKPDSRRPDSRRPDSRPSRSGSDFKPRRK